MTALIGISGSLRQASFNTALLLAIATLLPADTSLQICTLHGIPLYDGDLEAASELPASVSALKQAVVAAEGVLLVTPEYNNGIPGVFKHAIDWLSHPAAPLGTSPWFGARLAISHASDAFDAALAFKDLALQERIRNFAAGFVDAVRHSKR